MKDEHPRILIVDDDEDMCQLLFHLMKQEGFDPTTACDGHTAERKIRLKPPEVMLVDYKMPGMDGMELLKRTKNMYPAIVSIMITGHANIQGAVEAVKRGAEAYIEKPFKNDAIIGVIRQAIARKRPREKPGRLADRLPGSHQLREMMGPSHAVGKIISQVNRVANSMLSVLLEGETGAGKELVARAIHGSSLRAGGPFLPVDCGAIPESLFESELFGHVRGAFTGAIRDKPGKFEAAAGGTLFLDEITNLPRHSQSKLLRVLQEKKIYRVGSTRPIPMDARVLAAANQNFIEAMRSGSFREDLFYRLNELTLRVPPLRERREDIPHLARRFASMTRLDLGKEPARIAEAAMKALVAFDWPGNVRQLRSVIRRAVVLADEAVSEKDLNLHAEPGFDGGEERLCGVEGDAPDWKIHSLREIVQDRIRVVESNVLARVIRHTGGNKAAAARILKIDYKTIHTKLKRFGISSNGG